MMVAAMVVLMAVDDASVTMAIDDGSNDGN